jgi:hypothetical protein
MQHAVGAERLQDAGEIGLIERLCEVDALDSCAEGALIGCDLHRRRSCLRIPDLPVDANIGQA